VRARNDAGLTQKATAESLDWGLSKVVRIEQGNVPVGPTDVRAMLAIYGVTDQERIEELAGFSRQARDAQSWAGFDDITTPAFRELIAQEQAADRVYKYEPSVVPGLFQTDRYMRSLLAALGHQESDVDRRAELRGARQKILDLDVGPEIEVVLGEVALRRPAGDPSVMNEQLKKLIELEAHRRVKLAVLPFSAGVHPGMGTSFTILEFDDDDLDDTVYLQDAGKRSVANDDPELLESYLDLFEQLKDLAQRSGRLSDHVNRAWSDLHDLPPS